MTDLIGQYLGRYHILEQLGEGGMAVVYKAFDTNLERFVAVKVILPYQEHSGEFLARFKREAHALARLSHPNILKIFDSGEFNGHPYLVMEYISGGTLKDLMIEGPIPWQRSAQLLACIGRALEAAHAQHVIHRDVKPANILMANGKDPLLSDFGIAKLIQESETATTLTATGVGIGTPDYMAPEQGAGIFDEKCDIYSLGVILYQMVTGKLPFEADTPLAVIIKKNTEPLPRPTQFVPDLPAGVENVLLKALHRDPRFRYQHMSEFAAALEQLASRSDVQAGAGQETLPTFQEDSLPPPQPGPVNPKPSRALPAWLITAGALVLCCAALAGVVLVRRLILPGGFSRAGFLPPTGVPSPIPSETVQMPPVVLRPTSTPRPPATATPMGGSGQWIAFDSRMEDNWDIYLVDPNGGRLTQLTTSSAHDRYPSWSPDGRRIAYQTNEGGDQEIAILELATKKVTILTRNECDDWNPSWSPAGQWIAFYSNCDGDRNIYKIRTSGDDRTRLTSTSGSNSWFPAFSPDGRQITFSSNRSGEYRIYVMNADGSNVRDLARGCISYFSPDGTKILYGVYCLDTDDLFLMDADGSNQTALTDGYECKNATWSPDGRQIVFQLSQTTMEGPFELYRMLLDQPDRADWVLLTGYDVNGGSPVWQP